MGNKERLDKLLVDKGLVESREKAKRFIMANLVQVNGVTVTKSGTRIDTNSHLMVNNRAEHYVSRGGNKLNKALIEFNIVLIEKTVIDVGASTGGFTDCLLQFGAEKVCCVDVGYGQLDWSLRHDPRVINMEKTNIRYLTKEHFDFLFDLATVDVSFISLEKVFPVLAELLKPEGEVIALVKPQFEAGRKLVKKGGIVDNPDVHLEVINNLVERVQDNFRLINTTFSPLKNVPGNIEYFLYLKKKKGKNCLNPANNTPIKKMIEEAHKYFSKEYKRGESL